MRKSNLFTVYLNTLLVFKINTSFKEHACSPQGSDVYVAIRINSFTGLVFNNII